MDFIIYKLTNEDGRIYVGSTTQELKARIWHHKYHTSCACSDFNWDNVQSKVLEEGNGNNRLIRERYHMEQYNCCNKQRAYTTREEDLKRCRDWYEKNREQQLQKVKEYRERNREQIREKRKEKITCECGAEVCRRDIARHRKTKKHINRISLIS